MKTKSIFLISVIATSIIIVTIIFLYNVFWIIIILGNTGKSEEELLFETTSPNSTITLEAYQVGAGATVDYSVKVY